MNVQPDQSRQIRQPVAREAYRIGDAATALGISRTTIYEMVKIGDLKMLKIGGRSVIPASEIRRLTTLEAAA